MRAKVWIALFLLVALLVSAACGAPAAGDSPQSGQEATPAQGTGSTSETGGGSNTSGGVGTGEAPTGAEPTVAQGAGSGTSSSGLGVEDLAGLTSYRTHMVLAWTPESGDPDRMEVEEEFTRDPLARRIVMMDSNTGKTEVIQIGETAWLCTEGKCNQYPGNIEDMTSHLQPFNATQFEGRTVQQVGEETVNGIRTRHYVLTVTAADIALLSRGEVSDVHADIWVAADPALPAFMLRYVQTWKEKREAGNYSAEYSFETSDVNQPITIDPPKDVATIPEDIPVYPQAADLFISEGLYSYSTSDDVATVVAFYHTEMEAKGWSQTSEIEGDSPMISWSKDNRSVTVIVGSDDGKTTVTIMASQ